MKVGLQEERLPFWDRLIRGERVTLEEVDRVVTSAARDASDEERMASVLLLAAVEIADTGSRAMRQYLRAALLYWFSQAGDASQPADFNPRKLRDPGLVETIGLQLTWPQALQIVGFGFANNKVANYAALTRLPQCLREHILEQWKRVFGASTPNILQMRR